jgi:TatD DNase family protein
MELFDTHAHLDDEQFDSCRDAVVRRAGDSGIVGIVAVGCTAESSRMSVALAKSHNLVSAAVGIQPNYCHEAKPGDWDRIVELARESGVIAIGETGLDRYWNFSPFDVQQDFFDRHIRLSQETGLPFIVHMRDCGADILEMLRDARSRGPLRGVMHSYTGDADLAEACLELGLYISFAGMVTYKKSEDLRNVAAHIPNDRILIETDSPYLSPHPQRDQRPNEPALLIHTAECLAEVRQSSLGEFAAITTANARRLFGLRLR